MARSRSSLALGFGLLCWLTLLFSPLAFVQTAHAAESDADNYGTVIGIVSGNDPTQRSPPRSRGLETIQ